MNFTAGNEALEYLGTGLLKRLGALNVRSRTPSSPQEYAGHMHEPDEVLRILRGKFREICGMSEVPHDEPLKEMEIRGILALCYWIKKRYPEPSVAVRRRTSDYNHFVGGEGLPDYVLWVYTQDPDLNRIPPDRRSYYHMAATCP